jgi:hypothetical protein
VKSRENDTAERPEKLIKNESLTTHKWPCGSARSLRSIILRIDPVSMSEPEFVVMGMLLCVLGKAET